MPKPFVFCKVCRRNHDEGRGHRYGTKHLQRLSAALAKARQKTEDVLFFLHNPALLRLEDRPRNNFWCAICELQTQEQDSLIVCSNAIHHLASPMHEEKVKLFLSENGGKVDTKDMYIIKFEELLKWENASKALSVSSSSPGAGNNIQSDRYSNKMLTSELVCRNNFSKQFSDIVEPLTSHKGGISMPSRSDNSKALSEAFTCSRVSEDGHAYQHLSNGCSGFNKAHHERIQKSSEVKFSEQSSVLAMASGIHDPVNQGLAYIALPPSIGGEGNVHSGAPPPWLQGETNNQPSKNMLSRNEERRVKRMRNPNRVGAAWAEQRRAELEMENAKQVSKKEALKLWLPSFGRVWQGGSRKETRKEFEAERLQEKKLQTENNVEETHSPIEIKPYISKRQRLNSEAREKG